MSQRRVVGKHLILGQLLFEGLVCDEEGRSCRDVSKRLLPRQARDSPPGALPRPTLPTPR